jgi:hypothetical protein
MLWKATWFFEGFQNATYGAGSSVGWTESWSINDGPNTNIDNVFNNPDVLMYTNLRQQCLSVQYRMSFLRVNALPAPGVVPSRLVKIQSLNNIAGAASVFGQGGAQVQCCVLIDGQKLPVGINDRVHHRKFLCRGLPPDVINGNVLNTAAPNWPRFVAFFNFIANKPTGGVANVGRATQLGIAYQDPAFGKTPLPAVTVLNASPRLISWNDITAYLPGESVRISGWTGINGVQYNRVWNFQQSQVVGPNTVATFGKSRFDLEPGTSAFPNPASLQRIRFLVGPLDQYALIGLRSKRTGKVFHQLRGRSARRVRP